jgi:hypothetical protein
VYNNLHDSVNDKDEFAIEQRRSEYMQRKEEYVGCAAKEK